MLHDYKPDSPYHRFMPPMVGTQQDIGDLTDFLNAQVNPPVQPDQACAARESLKTFRSPFNQSQVEARFLGRATATWWSDCAAYTAGRRNPQDGYHGPSRFFTALAATALAPEAFAAEANSAAGAGDAPVMGSRVFDWNSIPAKPTSYGSVRAFCSRAHGDPRKSRDPCDHAQSRPAATPAAPPPPNEEMIILRQGTVETLSNGEWKRVGAGSVIFNGSNHFHGIKNVGTEPAIYHVINWKTAATPMA